MRQPARQVVSMGDCKHREGYLGKPLLVLQPCGSSLHSWSSLTLIWSGAECRCIWPCLIYQDGANAMTCCKCKECAILVALQVLTEMSVQGKVLVLLGMPE